MILGITGNSGSGKSKISKIISKKINAKIIDADKIVKKISKPETEYGEKIIELFGKEILIKNKLNKNKIAEIIYKNSEIRNKLNKITFKYVVDEIKKEINNSKKENVIIDAPLLIESGLNKNCDITIGVIAKKEIKIKRIVKRDKIKEEVAESRLKIQQQDEFYIKNTDYIIKNNGKIKEINLEEICTKIGKN